jgi:hypothetical protein
MNDIAAIRQLNPQAPPSYNGLQEGQAGQLFEDVPFDYIHDIVVAASATNNFEKSMDDDADFAWRGIVIVSQTAAFSVQFSDSQWYFLQSDLVSSVLLAGDASSPFAVWPELLIPAGGRIAARIRDDSAAENTIQIAYRGVKRYQLA